MNLGSSVTQGSVKPKTSGEAKKDPTFLGSVRTSADILIMWKEQALGSVHISGHEPAFNCLGLEGSSLCVQAILHPLSYLNTRLRNVDVYLV